MSYNWTTGRGVLGHGSGNVPGRLVVSEPQQKKKENIFLASPTSSSGRWSDEIFGSWRHELTSVAEGEVDHRVHARSDCAEDTVRGRKKVGRP